MFFIIESDERPDGYAVLSESNDWVMWLHRNIPATLANPVRSRLISNLKHLLVGLELKAALIRPHRHRSANERPVLFEPYFQNLILEFCVGSFSVLEGLGAAHWLAQQELDGGDGPYVSRERWVSAMCSVYDETNEFALRENLYRTLAIRDRLHQDRLGAREEIDWHAFSYDDAFIPACEAIRTLLRREADAVPENSILQLSPTA
ncbi:hypothetical protein [Emcibacter sp. SYSU 3D8]|uniref:hypothetical protein n=1 Tax=Emcibacter sp. SYSU 3D8 TaxID=3133969 RepID=UPI0031FED59E